MRKYVSRTIEQVIQVICERSIETEKGCYEWCGSISHNYGDIYYNGKMCKVHIIVYEYLHGKVTVGKELDHKCRNPKCWNDEHLEAVTHKVNVLRGNSLMAIQAKQTHCLNGHLLSGVNLYTRPDGKRNCRVCARERKRIWLQRTSIWAYGRYFGWGGLPV